MIPHSHTRHNMSTYRRRPNRPPLLGPPWSWDICRRDRAVHSHTVSIDLCRMS